MRRVTGAEIAVFNLERTAFEFVIHNALQDISMLEEAKAASLPERISMSQERDRFLGWIANKQKAELQPLLDRTAKATQNRLAPWARLAMGRLAAMGHKLCLYSATIPHELVTAYAEGIEATIPATRIPFVQGRNLIMESGYYAGGVGLAPKRRFIETLQSRGYGIYFTADSFMSSLGVIKQGRHQLIVNPDRQLKGSFESYQRHQLQWDAKRPQLVSIQEPLGDQNFLLDLSNQEHQDTFYSLIPGLEQ